MGGATIEKKLKMDSFRIHLVQARREERNIKRDCTPNLLGLLDKRSYQSKHNTTKTRGESHEQHIVKKRDVNNRVLLCQRQTTKNSKTGKRAGHDDGNSKVNKSFSPLLLRPPLRSFATSFLGNWETNISHLRSGY